MTQTNYFKIPPFISFTPPLPCGSPGQLKNYRFSIQSRTNLVVPAAAEEAAVGHVVEVRQRVQRLHHLTVRHRA